MAWTYYRQLYRNGALLLFREDDMRRQETFHRRLGWQADDALDRRRRNGEIDATDMIAEAEALALAARAAGGDAGPGTVP